MGNVSSSVVGVKGGTNTNDFILKESYGNVQAVGFGGKYVFLRNGIVCLVSSKTHRDGGRARMFARDIFNPIEDIDWRTVGKCLCFLTPTCQISRICGMKNNMILIQTNIHKLKTLSWCDSSKSVTGRENVRIRFKNESEANDWFDVLNKIITTNSNLSIPRLRQSTANFRGFNKEFQGAAWRVILSRGNYKLMKFFLNDLAISSPQHTDKGIFGSALFDNIFQNFVSMHGVNDTAFGTDINAEILVYLLMVYHKSTPLIQRIILYFQFSATIFSDFQISSVFSEQSVQLKESIRTSSDYMPPIRILHIFFASLPTDPSVQNVILQILPRPEDSSFRSKIIHLEEFKFALSSPLWILYYLLKENPHHAGLLAELQSEELESQFDIEEFHGANKTKPFVKLVLDLDNEIQRKNAIKKILNEGRVSDNFLRSYLAYGLKAGLFPSVKSVVLALMFPNDGNYTQTDFSENAVNFMPEAPVVIVEALYAILNQHTMQQLDRDCLLFLFLLCLRFELCAERGIKGVRSISEILRSRGKDASALTMKVVKIVNSLDIVKQMGRIYSHQIGSEFGKGGTVDDKSFNQDDFGLEISSSSLAVAESYSEKILVDVILGLFSLSVWTNLDTFQDWLKLGGGDFVPKILPRVKDRIKAVLVEKHGRMTEQMSQLWDAGDLLKDPASFSPEALKLMFKRNVIGSKPVYALVVNTALRLKDHRNLSDRVGNFMASQLIDSSIKEDITKYMLSNLCGRDQKDLEGLNLEDMSECIGQVPTVHAIFSGSNASSLFAKMVTMMKGYVDKQKPSTWLKLFKGAITIAIFIKYITREDLSKAYAKFRTINSDDVRFLELLDQVRSEYSTPFVTSDELDKMMRNQASEEGMRSFISKCRRVSQESTTSVADFFSNVSADWMTFTYESPIKIPLPPRNIQLIAAMSCIKWANRSDVLKGSALIGQVGTGEGKSLIIAMLAIYFAKVMRKKVHIVENNVSLLDKDFAQFENFYKMQGIRVCKKFEGIQDLGPGDVYVSYCLRLDPEGGTDLDSFYRDKTIEGKFPLKNAFLILDEVDELIVDENPNNYYVKNESGSGSLLIDSFRALKAGGIGARKPSNVPYRIWNEACKGFKDAKNKKKDRDYVQQGNDIYMKIDGNVKKRSTATWLNYVKYYILGDRADVSFQSYFFYQSMPFLMSQYERIFGLSGSLGSNSEQEFLRTNFFAETFLAPSFLDTCTDFVKEPPKLLGDRIRVCDTRASQVNAITALALEMFQTVPVLVIAKSTSDIVESIKAGVSGPKYRSILNGNEANDVVQLLLQYKPETATPMPYAELVEKATKPIIEGLPARRITVTDAFGGRGHDYAVYDDIVDLNGGLLVIVADVPPSEREWVQWKGRTARSDRKGQYAIILCKNEGMKSALDTAGADMLGCYTQRLLDILLEQLDKDTGAKLSKVQPDIETGRRVNELCDMFYAKYPRGKDDEWPKFDDDQKLIEFISAFDFKTDSIQRFKSSIGLSAF